MKNRYIVFLVTLVGFQSNYSLSQDCLTDQDDPDKILNCISYKFDSIGDYNYDFEELSLKLKESASYFSKAKKNKSYIRSITYLGLIYEQQNSLSIAKHYFDRAEKSSKDKGFPQLEFWVQSKRVGLYRKTGDYSTAIIKLESIVSRGSLELSNRDKAKLSTTLGYYYQTIGKAKKSISLFFDALNFAKDITDKQLKAIIYNNLGNSYAIAGDFATAEIFFQKGVDVFGDESKVEIPILFNNIAEMNEEQGFLDKALKYYYKGYKYTSPLAYEQVTEIAINISNIWLEKEESDSAIYYLNVAMINSEKFGLKSLERVHALHMKFLVNRNIYGNSEALEPLAEAYRISFGLNLTAELARYSLDLSQLYDTLNILDSSHFYLQRHLEYKNVMLNQSSQEQLIRKTEESKLDSIRVQSMMLSADKDYLELEVSKRNSVVVLVSCVLGSLLLAGYFFWRSLRRKKQLLGIELENKKLTIVNQNKELIGANLEIESRTRALKQLNEKIKDNLSQEYDPHFNELSQVLREGSRLMNEQERKKYINNLIKLDNSFYQRLKELYRGLTDDELKLAALIRLNLSTDELVDIFNISRTSLNTKRYRLRKKLLLESNSNSNSNLDQFIHEF